MQLAVAGLPFRVEYTPDFVAFATLVCLFFLAAQPVMTIKRPKANPVKRILGRIASQLNAIRGGSGDESDVRQVNARRAGREEGFKDSLTG